MIRPLLLLVVLAAAPATLADVAPPPPAEPAPAAPPVDAPPVDAPVDEAAADAPAAAPPDAKPELKLGDPAVDERLKDLPPPQMGFSELIGPLAKTMLMLCVVLFIVYLTLHKGLGKLVERQNIGKRVKVVERTALDTRRTLFLVEVDGQQMLIAGGDGGVTVLKDLGRKPDDVVASASSAGGLGARFADALKSRVSGTPPVTTGLSKTDITTDIEKA